MRSSHAALLGAELSHCLSKQGAHDSALIDTPGGLIGKDRGFPEFGRHVLGGLQARARPRQSGGRNTG